MTFRVVLDGRVVLTRLSGQPLALDVDTEHKLLEEHLDAVMDELMTDERASDVAVDASIQAGSIAVSLGVQAENPVDATNLASLVLRTAIHAAGGATPDWPELAEEDGEWCMVLEGLNVRGTVLTPA